VKRRRPALRLDTADLTVDRLGARGDGIAEWRGRPVYLPFTVPGDRVRAELGAERGDGRSGKVVALLEAGPGRAEPACRHFGRCGGCSLQHLSADAYGAAKLALLREALAHHGLGDAPIRPLVRVSPGTRRRVRFTVARTRSGGAIVGFHETGSHAAVDLAECPVLQPELVELAGGLRVLAPRLLQPGENAAATATLADSGIDLLLELPAVPDLGALETLAGFAETADLARVAWSTGREAPVPVALRRPATVRFGAASVELPFGAFLQAARDAEAAMTAAVREIVAAADPVADLYAGLGAFSFALTPGARVHAVEGEAAAAAALGRAANASGLATRVTVERRDLEQHPLDAAELARFGAVVLDPPRAGAKAQSRALAASSVPVVAAVSCNPATFARDARALVDGGYRLGWVQPIDQFLWSSHLELVAAFARD
jgi:23S rRNA (uracil1939-C5)-methyltransferase